MYLESGMSTKLKKWFKQIIGGKDGTRKQGERENFKNKGGLTNVSRYRINRAKKKFHKKCLFIRDAQHLKTILSEFPVAADK